ncbi:hypothetical protein D3C85_1034040 [compost metagenome]
MDNFSSEMKYEFKVTNEALGEFFAPKEHVNRLAFDVNGLKDKMFDVEVALKRRP